MSAFGEKSTEILEELCPELQLVMAEAIKSNYFDFSLVQGFRSGSDQEIAFAAGNSKAHAGESPHNYFPSYGVDVIPYPSGYKDGQAMLLLAGHILGTAERMGIDLTCGCDWDRDGMVIDTNFKDFWHFELKDWRL